MALQGLSLGDLIGIHGSLGATEYLQSELFNICTGRNGVCNCLILRVFDFELSQSNLISRQTQASTREGKANHLLQLVHKVCCIDFDLIIGIVKPPLYYLIHDMEITYDIGGPISTDIPLRVERGFATHTSRQPQVWPSQSDLL